MESDVYAKIFEQIYDSSIAEDYQVRYLFMDLLVLANKDGIVDMTQEAISRRINVPVDIVNRCLRKLAQPDPDSRSPDQDGARIVLLDDHRDWGWQIVNYTNYRNIRTENARTQYHREYQRKRRERKRLEKEAVENAGGDVNTSTDVNTSQHESTTNASVCVSESFRRNTEDQDTSSHQGVAPGFVRFWSSWPSHPRKVGKSKCLAYWNRHGLEARAAAVIAVLERDKASDQWCKDGGQFIPLVATWLNQGRWDADLAEKTEAEKDAAFERDRNRQLGIGV